MSFLTTLVMFTLPVGIGLLAKMSLLPRLRIEITFASSFSLMMLMDVTNSNYGKTWKINRRINTISFVSRIAQLHLQYATTIITRNIYIGSVFGTNNPMLKRWKCSFGLQLTCSTDVKCLQVCNLKQRTLCH